MQSDLTRFERFLREIGVPKSHTEFYRHVFSELSAYLDTAVAHATSDEMDAFLDAKLDAGLPEKRHQAYRHVLDHVIIFQNSVHSGRHQAVEDDDLDDDFAAHASGALGDDVGDEMPGESTRAINEAPLLARAALKSGGADDEGGGSFFKSSSPRGQRHGRLASLEDHRHDESNGLFRSERSSTAIPDFMEASGGPELIGYDEEEDELTTLDVGLDDDSELPVLANAERDRIATDDLPAPRQRAAYGNDLPAARSGPRSEGEHGDLPVARKAHDDLPSARSTTREVPDDLPAARSKRDEMRSGSAVRDLPAPRKQRSERPTKPSSSKSSRRVKRPHSSRRRSRSDDEPTPPAPTSAVDEAPSKPERPTSPPATEDDPLGLFGDIEEDLGFDPLAPASGRPREEPSGNASAAAAEKNPPKVAAPSPSKPTSGAQGGFSQRPVSALLQASAGPATPDSGSGESAPGGFSRRSTLKGVGKPRESRRSGNAKPTKPPSGSAGRSSGSGRQSSHSKRQADASAGRRAAAPPGGGAVAFSKLGLLEPEGGEVDVEIEEDIDTSSDAAGPSLRSVSVPDDAVQKAKPIPGGVETGKDDALRRAKRRLESTIRRADKEREGRAEKRTRRGRFRPFVYADRFPIDRPAPKADTTEPVDTGSDTATGPVLKKAVVPLSVVVIGLLLAAAGGVTISLGVLVVGAILAGVGAFAALVAGIPTLRWLSVGRGPIRRNTPDAVLASYHELLWAGNHKLAYRCLARDEEALPIPDDYDVRQRRRIGDAFNRLDYSEFERYWRIHHELAQASGLGKLWRRGRPAEIGESRLVAGSVDGGTVLLVIELPGGHNFWLVPAVRLDGLWYLVDGQLYPREVETSSESAGESR